MINTYDNLDRLTEKRYNGSNDSVKIAYNTQGQTFAVKDTANSRYTKFTYDLAGRVVRSATYPTATMNGAFVTDMRYGYESKTNRLAEFSYRMPNQGSTTGEYRTANFNLIYGTGANIDRVTALQMQGENRIRFAYDGFGRVTNRTYSATGGESPRVTTYTYHDVGEDRTTSLVKTVNNSGLGEIGYTYDAVGNITQITKDGAVQESYTYDSLNQLKTVTRGGVTTEYSYQNGNITSVTQNGETVKTYGYTDSTWSDLLTSFNGQTITYDEIGNPLQYRDGMSFTWAKGRQLQSVTKNGVTTSYTYDENGLRLSKTTGGVTTKIYRTNGQMVGMNSSDGKDLMFLLDGSGNVYGLHYDHYSSETQTAAATYYFAYNAQGDVIGIYDASGTVVATYAYDEWGNCTVQVLAADSNGHSADSPDHIAQVNPFRYRGYFYDNETGLYYLNSRYYDPETCRFLNADNAISGTGESIQGYNLFAYCFNNSVNMADSSGHWPQWLKNIASSVKNVVDSTINGIKSVVASISNTLNSSHDANRRPNTGEPGSTYRAPNGDTRTYGPDGNPLHDYDHDDHGNPANHPHDENGGHNHDWDDGVRGPAYSMNWEAAAGLALVTISVVGIVAVAANDATGVGVADDFLFVPLGAGVREGLILIFS